MPTGIVLTSTSNVSAKVQGMEIQGMMPPDTNVADMWTRAVEVIRLLGHPMYVTDPEPTRRSDMSTTPADHVSDLECIMARFKMSAVDIGSMSPAAMLNFLSFRMKHKIEELREAYNAIVSGKPEPLVDAIVDLWYICVGTLVAFGIDARKAWKSVHDANMAKEPGVNPKRFNPLGLPDMVKPEGWSPPSHSDNLGLLPVAISALEKARVEKSIDFPASFSSTPLMNTGKATLHKMDNLDLAKCFMEEGKEGGTADEQVTLDNTRNKDLVCHICGAVAYPTPTGWQCAAHSDHRYMES